MLMLIASGAFAQQVPGTQYKTEGNNSPMFPNNNGPINVNYTVQGRKDARTELATRGIPWGTEAFCQALIHGDETAVTLFLKGRIDLYGECQKTYAIAKFISDTKELGNFERIFNLLLKHGLNVDHKLKQRLSSGMTTLAEHAVAAEHLRAFQLLWKASKKKEAARIRAAIEKKIAERQKEQHGDGASKAQAGDTGRAALIKMLLELDRSNQFMLTGYKAHAGPVGWVLELETNSIVDQISYEINNERKTVWNTTWLPIAIEGFTKPHTPVHVEARDVHGRALQVTLLIDREDLQ
ncbi:hypothetical protein [Archangium violaceum]|uniref:hypothetical protein n=1 Tax=Archangium violaceum TaxID=83451 RepID=UPI001363FAD1|nr:hypothetical protein [Archangium violaceum]